MIESKSKVFCLSILFLGSLCGRGAMAAPRLKVQCEGLFESQPEPKSSKSRRGAIAVVADKVEKTTAVVSRVKSGLSVEPDVPMHIKERIVIEEALSHYVSSNRIPLEYASGVDSKPKTDQGEFVAVSFITDKAPTTQVSEQLRLGNAGAGRTQLGYSQGRNAVAVSTFRPMTVADIRAKRLDPVEVLSNFIRHETADTRLDQRSVDYIVKTMQNDPDYMGRAVAYHESRTLRVEGQSVGRGQAVNLANTGSYRYFRFTPEGATQEVIARVLDINHVVGAYAGFNVLVEWMRPANEMDVRIRHVQSLKVSELKSMRPMSDTIRRMIEAEFNDSLTPYEMAAQKLAAKAGLRTFGFTEMSRRAGGSDTGADPFRGMSGISHVASRDAVIKRFGKLDDLLTTDELGAPGNWRIFDVMARLNPKYVLKRFNGRGTGFVYMFVITEDGQLKVAPFTEGSANYKPELLRFAHGRRIFAGGTFIVAKDNRLEVTLESNRYQDIEAQPGSHQAFRTEGQGNLDSFVAYVFAMQAGRQLSNLASAFAETFYSNRSIFDDQKPDDIAKERYDHDARFKFTGAQDGSGANFSGSFGGFTSRNIFADARRDMFEAAMQRARTPDKRLEEWSDENGPLRFEQWRELHRAKYQSFESTAGLRARDSFGHLDIEDSIEFYWAYYVLRANYQMSFDQIKGSYRKLRAKLHPDHYDSSREEEMRARFQVVQSAYEVIEKRLKK